VPSVALAVTRLDKIGKAPLGGTHGWYPEVVLDSTGGGTQYHQSRWSIFLVVRISQWGWIVKVPTFSWFVPSVANRVRRGLRHEVMENVGSGPCIGTSMCHMEMECHIQWYVV
jgi:hypothetical protein